MICKITNFLRIFFNREKNSSNSLNFKNEKNRKIRILDLWLNARGVAKYSNFEPFKGYISETVQDMIKLLLITNRKSHISFRLEPNSVTLNDLEQRNSFNRGVISSNSVAFGADYIKVVEDTPILCAADM